MNALEFCYSLQGYAELSFLTKAPCLEEWGVIVERLKTVEIDDETDNVGQMTPANFVGWLRGFVEISDSRTIHERQWNVIKAHLNLVFKKVTTECGDVSVKIVPEDQRKKILKEIEEKIDPSCPWGPGGPEIHPYKKIFDPTDPVPMWDRLCEGPKVDEYFCTSTPLKTDLICARTSENDNMNSRGGPFG